MTAMNTSESIALLGHISPDQFMRHYWQKQPLLVRAAVPQDHPMIPRSELFNLAAREEIESRLVVRRDRAWELVQGPIAVKHLPKTTQPDWTLLVQGVDLHLPAARALLSQFAFVPSARLDDVMVSWASDGGGVGPHVDSYDVFLLQLQGRRRWRIGPVGNVTLVPDAPLKLLQKFEPQQSWDLEPGDMLYLPPGWAHEGVALGECMTASIGFRAPGQAALGREVLQYMLDGAEPLEADALYSDAAQQATTAPGRIPAGLQAFAADAVARFVQDPGGIACALGELLSEPKPKVWFEARAPWKAGQGVVLDRATRMVYDDDFVFINGESLRADGDDARLMHGLADMRQLAAQDLALLGDDAQQLVAEWVQAGWLHSAG
jgi:50S ribosomal protein L16 3-hydroxylase